MFLSYTFVYGQCLNSAPFGSASAPTDNITETISTCSFQDEYSTISDVIVGETYEVDIDCGGYITVRSSTFDGAIVEEGPAPLSWTAASNDDHYIHWNTDSSCGTATDCCETNITCTSCPILPPTQQDCEGAQIVCNNNSFSGNSDGSGNYVDLDTDNEGCLSGENESSWYYVNIGTGGTLEMSINPEQDDDYDFAIWGPYTETNADDNCPPIEDPIRCSWAAGAGETGLGNGATDLSEGVGGDDWVAPINTAAGEIYILLIDNYSETNDPFDLNWDGSAVLDCTPVNLPVELLDFTVSNQKRFNLLEWSTSSEKNNDYFQIKHSIDGKNWSSIGNIQGAGTTNSEQAYSLTHSKYSREINYYRLKQVDYDGTTTDHGIISIDNREDVKLVKRVNALGQEVDETYKGVVFEYYSDGSTRKVMQ